MNMLHYVLLCSFQLPVISLRWLHFYLFNFIKNERKFDMKNFKLLLATTAILSAGALLANATGITGNETAIVPVVADIVTPLLLTVEKPLDFGVIAAYDINTLEVTMNNQGETSITNSTSSTPSIPLITDTFAYILKQGGMGVVSGATCSNIALPEVSEVTLTNSGGSYTAMDCGGMDPEICQLERSSNYSLTSLNCITVDGKAKIYGTLSMDAGSGGLAIPAGRITGNIVVTAVYDDRSALPTGTNSYDDTPDTVIEELDTPLP